jgi:hypothetical protein
MSCQQEAETLIIRENVIVLGKTSSGVGSSLSFPRKSADSQTGPTISKVATSAPGEGGETSSICCDMSNGSTESNKIKVLKQFMCVAFFIYAVNISMVTKAIRCP